MKIPKYIDEALEKRTKAANLFCHYDLIVSRWLGNNGFANEIDSADFFGGVESLVNPEDSEERIREAIRNRK